MGFCDNLNVSKLRYPYAALLIFFVFSMLFSSVSADDQEVASASISEAESVMLGAYEAVLEAENLDADVSGLLVRLNDGAKSLSNARMAFDVGDFSGAKSYAESASELGYGVMGEAKLLENAAADARANSSWVNLVISVVGVSVVLISSVVGYKLFKVNYYKRLSRMKPKVE